jgi:hypothetical protein
MDVLHGHVERLVLAGLVLGLVLWGPWYLLTDGGPVNGSASTAEEFVGSFPESWECVAPGTDIGVSWKTSSLATVQCPSGATYIWSSTGGYSEEDAARVDLAMGRHGFEHLACTVVSGTATAYLRSSAAATMTTLDTYREIRELAATFADDARLVGDECPLS